MSAEALGMVMECKEWMGEEAGRVKTVVEELSKKMWVNSLSILNDERMERNLKRVRRRLESLESLDVELVREMQANKNLRSTVKIVGVKMSTTKNY